VISITKLGACLEFEHADIRDYDSVWSIVELDMPCVAQTSHVSDARGAWEAEYRVWFCTVSQ
jgi:hypothetical protein